MPVKLNRQAGKSCLYLLENENCLLAPDRQDMTDRDGVWKRVEFMQRECLSPETALIICERFIKGLISKSTFGQGSNFVITFLTNANDFTRKVIDNFNATGFNRFYTIHKWPDSRLSRQNRSRKGYNPFKNLIMAWNLLYQEVNFNLSAWKESVVEMLKKLPEATLNYFTSFNFLAGLQQNNWALLKEIVKKVDNSTFSYKEILHIFMPDKVLKVFANKNRYFPLFSGYGLSASYLIFVCNNNTCLTPVPVVKSFIRLFDNNHSFVNVMYNNNISHSLDLAEEPGLRTPIK